MPNDKPVDTSAHAAPYAGADNPPLAGVKDRFGEELADDARIWRLHNDVAKDDDEKRVNNWDRGLNNLALFAGLFSAVTTAFIIEARKDMEPDYAQLSFLVLNATASGRPFVQEQFIVPSGARTVNCLWIASLAMSLSAALIAIMGKDWIGTYSIRPICNPRQWAEIRAYRLQCVERWHMSPVIATAPVLLHFSLIFFGAGLYIFASNDPFTQHLTLGLSMAAAGLYLITGLSAVIFSSSPFKSPPTQAFRAFVVASSRSVGYLLSRSKSYAIDTFETVALVFAAVLMPPERCMSSANLDDVDPEQRRRPQRRYTHRFWNLQQITWRDQFTQFWNTVASLVLAVPGLLRTAWDEYRFRWQRPHRRPWMTWNNFADVFLSSRWSEVSAEPRAELLAESLSWLSITSPSPENLRSILFALGDIHTGIGHSVANHVSRELRLRVENEMLHNRTKADLLTFSRYILADRNMSPGRPPLCFFDPIVRFPELRNPAVRGADMLVALLKSSAVLTHLMGQALCEELCQDTPLDLRTLTFLLSSMIVATGSSSIFIILLNRAAHHWPLGRVDHFKAHLRSHIQADHGVLIPFQEHDKATVGTIELLCFTMTKLDTVSSPLVRTAAAELIMRILWSEWYSYQATEHPWLVNAFGSADDEAIWQSVSGSPLRRALPLFQYRHSKWDDRDAPPKSETRREFEMCLVRVVIRSFAPRLRDRENDRFEAEHSTRSVHVQLCHPRSLLRNDDKDEVIDRILEHSFLLHASGENSYYFWDIVSTIASRIRCHRHTAHMRDKAVHVMSGLVSHEFTDKYGVTAKWDLAEYIVQSLDRLSSETWLKRIRELDCLRNFLDELEYLRPLFQDREEFRVFWQAMPDVNKWSYLFYPELDKPFNIHNEPEAARLHANDMTADAFPAATAGRMNADIDRVTLMYRNAIM